MLHAASYVLLSIVVYLLQWERDHVDFNFDTSKGPVTNEWFQGGRTNLAYNCLDRWVPLSRRQVPAVTSFASSVGQVGLDKEHTAASCFVPLPQ